MKLLKYIFVIFVLLGLLQPKLKAEIIVTESGVISASFSEHIFKDQSKETKWLNLLYLQESTNQNQSLLFQLSSRSLSQYFSGELYLKSIAENIESSFPVGGNLESHQENGGWGKAVFHDNPDLVDSRGKLFNLGDDVVPQALRRDPDFLKKFDDVANDADLNKHIFDGEPQFDGNLLRGVSGVHSNKNLVPSSQTTGLSRGDVRIQPDSKVDLGKGYYEAKVQVYGDKGAPGGTYLDDWVKGKKSTFFPDNWSLEKIQAEIANGIKNKIPDPDFPASNGNIAFKATMTDGTKLQMVYDGDKLISSFPNLR